MVSPVDYELIEPQRLPHTTLRAGETLLKRAMFNVEQGAVERAEALYREAYYDLRTTAGAMADSAGVVKLNKGSTARQWNSAFMTYVEQRLHTLLQAVTDATRQATATALTGSYYGRLWLLDMATPENVQINIPRLQGAQILDALREDEYSDMIRELLGAEWRADYGLEMDSLVLEIRRALGQGMVNGEGVGAVMRRVAGSMGVTIDRRRGGIGTPERRGYRANFNRVQVITRTVINRMSNAGAISAYKANADVLSGYEWLTARDERVCVDCAAMDGKTFTFKSLRQPPLHPNCRCTVIPIIRGKALGDPNDDPRQSFPQWAKEHGMDAELARFLKPTGVRLTQPAPRTPARVRTIDGIFSRPNGTPGGTLDSLNAYIARNSDDALSYAMADYEVGMLKVDYSRVDDYFLIDRDVVRREAAAFVRESMDIRYSKDYLLQVARERAAANGLTYSAAEIEAAYNATYAIRAEAIETLARIDGLRLTPAQYRRLEQARAGNYLEMVYSREGSATGSLQNAVNRSITTQRRPGGSANYSAGARREARENFREWVQGIE